MDIDALDRELNDLGLDELDDDASLHGVFDGLDDEEAEEAEDFNVGDAIGKALALVAQVCCTNHWHSLTLLTEAWVGTDTEVTTGKGVLPQNVQ